MGKGAIAPILIAPKEPNICCEEADGGFYKKFTLEMDHSFVETKDNGSGDLTGVGNVEKAGGIEGIASMAPGKVVEVEAVEGGFDGKVVFFLLKGVVGE